MITNAELDHVRKIQNWAKDTRSGLDMVKANPVFDAIFEKISAEYNTVEKLTILLDNIEWLVAIVQREAGRQLVKRLSTLGEGPNGQEVQ